MIPLASLDDLEARSGEEYEGADLSRAQTALHDASALVRSAAGQDWLADDGITLAEVPTLVVSIVCAVARRGVENPEGYVSERIGEYSYQRGAQAGGTGGLYLTADERRALSRFRISSGLGSLQFERFPDPTRRVQIVNGEPL